MLSKWSCTKFSNASYNVYTQYLTKLTLYLRIYISGIDQASWFHLAHISLSITVITFTPIVIVFDLWIRYTHKLVQLFKSPHFHCSHCYSYPPHLVIISYFICLPSHFSSMEQVLMLMSSLSAHRVLYSELMAHSSIRETRGARKWAGDSKPVLGRFRILMLVI